MFLDTSFLYALADAKDADHQRAKRLFQTALEKHEEVCTHNYVIVESGALIHRRLGFTLAKKFLSEASLFPTIWVDKFIHDEARELFSLRAKRKVSFVDCVSFALMKQKEIGIALAFDDDFRKEGFELYR